MAKAVAMKKDDSAILPRVTAICCALPEVAASSATGQHWAFAVRGKKFIYYLVDHHGDGRIAINVKAPPGEQGRLVAGDPKRYFVPAYLGAKGWVGYRLDIGRTNWAEVERLCIESYLLLAPKQLAAQVAG